MMAKDFHAQERARGALRGENFSLVPEQARLDVLQAGYDPRVVVRRDLEPGVYLLRNVMTEAECRALIQAAARRGFQRAGLAIGNDEYRVNLGARNNSRVLVDDPDLAAALWTRVGHLVDPRYKGCRAVGLNWRFRIYRYEVGQRFRPHVDQVFALPGTQLRTLCSFMIYLNEGFRGGETTFFAWRGPGRGRRGGDRVRRAVAPETGAALVFDHLLFHEGSEVTHGVKYAVRSDLFYTR